MCDNCLSDQISKLITQQQTTHALCYSVNSLKDSTPLPSSLSQHELKVSVKSSSILLEDVRTV